MLLDESLKNLSTKLRSGEISSVDLATEAIDRMIAIEPKINSLIFTLDPQEILNQAKEYSRQSALSGIPYVLKDAYVTHNIQTTAASNVLKNYSPQYDATVVRKLKDSQAVMLGKANMDAWGHGGSTENTDFGVTKNPWNLEHVAGGSSGGPAAAIASRLCTFAIGEDTGGSIRNPAGFTNTTGLKVSYGRVSRYGSIAYASSFDTVGPMAKTAEDCAYVLQEIAGLDPYDATTSQRPVDDYLTEISNGISGKIIGLPTEFISEGIDPEIKQIILTAAKEFEALGAQIVEVSLPMLKYAISIYYLLAPSETSSNLGRYDGIRYGQDREKFSLETIRRIMIGTYALSSGYYDQYYKKAQKARTLIIKDYQNVFEKCDFLLAPISPTTAPKIGELISDPVKNLMADIYTVTTNPAGIPALALPAGFTKSKLPVGMQLQGKMFSEKLLLQAGYAYQQVTNWHNERPSL